MRERKATSEHSLVQLTVGDVDRIQDPIQRIDIIDAITASLTFQRGNAVLERAKMQASGADPQKSGLRVEPAPEAHPGLSISQ